MVTIILLILSFIIPLTLRCKILRLLDDGKSNIVSLASLETLSYTGGGGENSVKKHRLLLVDNHEVVRLGLRTLIENNINNCCVESDILNNLINYILYDTKKYKQFKNPRGLIEISYRYYKRRNCTDLIKQSNIS